MLFRSFDSLAEDLTRLLEDNVKLTGAIRTIYTVDGKKVIIYLLFGIFN